MFRSISIFNIILLCTTVYANTHVTALEDIISNTKTYTFAQTGSGTISGNIYTYFGDPLQNAKVKLSSNQVDFPLIDNSNVNGAYAFPNLNEDLNYKIVPSKSGDWLNGVSTLDLIILSRITLGRYTDVSAYSYIAADINKDRKINISDVIALAKVLLGLNDNFPNNKSWNFVDSDHIFFDNERPWPFPKKIKVNNLSGESADNNFIAIKIGDLSGNANPQLRQNSETRSERIASLRMIDQDFIKGEQYTIELRHSDLNSAAGFQINLNYQDIEISNIQSDIFKLAESNVNLTDHNLKISCYELLESNIQEKDETLISLTIVANSDSKLSEILSIASESYNSEMYFEDIEFSTEDIVLEFEQESQIQPLFTLDQNAPNPFRDRTEVSFNSQVKAEATFEVFSLTGQNILSSQITTNIGKNSIILDKSMIDKEGIYMYKLTIQDRYESKLLIVSY